MDYQSYLDWTEVSGIYLRQYSHLERYRTFQQQISPAGLNTLIVAEFLHDNPQQTLNVTDWRSYSVYEASGDQQERLKLTAAALDAIGAAQTAQAVRTSQSASPFDGLLFNDPNEWQKLLKTANPADMLGHLQKSLAQIASGIAGTQQTASQKKQPATGTAGTESWQDISNLLEAYVTCHQQSLEEDLARHGDPRILPGYSRKERLKELDQAREQLFRQEEQATEVRKIRDLLTTLQKKLNGVSKVTPELLKKLKSPRKKFLDKLKTARKQVRQSPLPEMLDLLKEADEFIQTHPTLFAQQPLGDAKLEQRLAALGEYDRNEQYEQVYLTWERPDGFDVGWTHFDLAFTVPQGEVAAAVQSLLDTAERLRQNISTRSEEWKQQLIQSFREQEGWMEEWELEEAELDAEGLVTAESIFQMAGTGQIHFTAYDRQGEEISGGLFFPVEWDPEHGFQLEWEEEAEPEPVADIAGTTSLPAGQFSSGKVQFREPGPALNEADLNRLEQQYGIQLPAEYRSFLLSTNGGIPEPNHLALKLRGDQFPYDIEVFFSLAPATAAETIPAERNLEQILTTQWQGKTPRVFLPIARVKSYSHYLRSEAVFLYLPLTGKKVGQPVVFDQSPLLELSALRNLDDNAQAATFEEHINYAQLLGKSLGTLLQKLKPLPEIDVPDWLRMIRADDRAGFLAWLAAGGSLKTTHQAYGQFAPAPLIDFLVEEASIDLLKELLAQQRLKPKQIRQSWYERNRHDLDRFRQLMPILPQDLWPYALSSYNVWDHFDLLEELAEAGVNFNVKIGDQGKRPLDLAVQRGHKAAVKWLMEHGADPEKEDNYGRNAFTWAENGPGFECLPILQGKPERPEPTAPPAADSPGIALLNKAAAQLPEGTGLRLSLQIKSPPVTRVEKLYYQECHYTLMIDVGKKQVTFKDVTTPRQDYLYASQWPETLFLPILQWPALTPLWDTLQVEEIDWSQALKKRNYQATPRPDLHSAAQSALEQGFDQQEAHNRGIRLRKN